MNYSLLKKIVQDAKFKYNEDFSYNNVNFLLFPCKFTKKDVKEFKSPVFVKPSDIADWDIYFGVNLIETEFRKPILLHEILEFSVYSFLLDNVGINSENFREISHNFAKSIDDKYAKDIFDDVTYSKYCAFRNGWENFVLKNI